MRGSAPDACEGLARGSCSSAVGAMRWIVRVACLSSDAGMDREKPSPEKYDVGVRSWERSGFFTASSACRFFTSYVIIGCCRGRGSGGGRGGAGAVLVNALNDDDSDPPGARITCDCCCCCCCCCEDDG